MPEWLTRELLLGVVCLLTAGVTAWATAANGPGAYTVTGSMVGLLGLFWLFGGLGGHGTL